MDASVCNIMDMPDEILIEIILRLNPGERVPLGDSCKRFHRLVFEDKKLLRDLDFSGEGYYVSESDIDKYFCNNDGNKHILKLDLRNVDSIKNLDKLFGHISKAINLVEINLTGLRMNNVSMLAKFLTPLPQVRRLSFEWPEEKNEWGDCYQILRKEFRKLTYLSVTLWCTYDFGRFYQTIHSSQELKELHITAFDQPKDERRYVGLNMKLNGLKILEYYGPGVRMVANHFVSILSHPEEWTHFQLFDHVTEMNGFYLERNVEVCEELLESRSLKRLSYNYPQFASQLGGFVVSTCLLKEVMSINQGDLPEKLCCFSSAVNKDEGQLSLPSVLHISKLWTLKIEEAKRLLRDPQYQISYLRTSHDMERDCDAHIVTSAFPSLTELVLTSISMNKRTTSNETMYSDKRPDESSHLANIDSSFCKLVKSTPQLRHLTVNAGESPLRDDKTWDLTALHFISHWKSLTTLRLCDIPIEDGKFLIEIGKQCKHLENVTLYRLGLGRTHCYTTDLLQMLIHCRHLTDFKLEQENIRQLSEIVFRLADNPQLRRVSIKSEFDANVTDLTPSVERLGNCCLKLRSFKCSVGMSLAEARELKSTLQRVRRRLNRETFIKIS